MQAVVLVVEMPLMELLVRAALAVVAVLPTLAEITMQTQVQ